MNIYLNRTKAEVINSYWRDKMPMMAMEELAELTQAISKLERFGLTRSDLKDNCVTEISDVLISIGALMVRYDITDDMVEEKICEKLSKDYKHDIYNWCEEHGISARARNRLLSTHMSLDAFKDLSEKELYKIRGAGKETVEEYKRMQEILKNEL